MNSQEVRAIVDDSLGSATSEVNEAFNRWALEPYSELRYTWDKKTELIWIVAIISEANIGIGFSENGYEGLNLHWGLLFLDNSYIGSFGDWYIDLHELVIDCGYI